MVRFCVMVSLFRRRRRRRRRPRRVVCGRSALEVAPRTRGCVELHAPPTNTHTITSTPRHQVHHNPACLSFMYIVRDAAIGVLMPRLSGSALCAVADILYIGTFPPITPHNATIYQQDSRLKTEHHAVNTEEDIQMISAYQHIHLTSNHKPFFGED